MEDDMCPPLPSSVASTTAVSPNSVNFPAKAPEVENFSLHFASMYHSIFPSLSSSSLPSSLSFTPSPCSSSAAAADDGHQNQYTTTTDDLLFQARLILEHREHHDLCLRRLRDATKEADYLRRENAKLRLANEELVKLLSSKTAVGVDDVLATPNNYNFRRVIGGGQISPTSVIRNNHQLELDLEGRNLRRIALPKSISVRSPLLNIQSSGVGVPGSGESGKREEAMELEVYNQGMAKTELCNKWEHTGGCPYGEHCRFAHGLEELRPVMRHPRYKTQMCRMVLAGSKCPYGHRCHFRHSLLPTQPHR